MNRDSPHAHNLQVVHVGGRLCWLDVIPGPIGATIKRMMPLPIVSQPLPDSMG
jgi:hypothetical protein